MTSWAAAAALVSLSWGALAAPKAASRPPVSRSTATPVYELTAEPENIPALKRQIESDQEEVRKTRAAYKKAQKSGDAVARAKARDGWLAAKEALRADRRLLRQAIEAEETEGREARRLRSELNKTQSLKP